jgi:V8-like Glu-specific endopeptidase
MGISSKDVFPKIGERKVIVMEARFNRKATEVVVLSIVLLVVCSAIPSQAAAQDSYPSIPTVSAVSVLARQVPTPNGVSLPDGRAAAGSAAQGVVRMESTFSTGTEGCTGSLASSYIVLTAGHCIYNKSNGGWATRVTVHTASGTYTVNQSSLMAMASWTGTNASYANDPARYDMTQDLGAILLPVAAGGSAGVSYSVPGSATIVGYPYCLKSNSSDGTCSGGTKVWGTPYKASGTVTNAGAWLQFNMDATPGMSGSALFDSAHHIVGVYVAGYPTSPFTNFAVALSTPAAKAFVQSALAKKPAAPAKPAAPKATQKPAAPKAPAKKPASKPSVKTPTAPASDAPKDTTPATKTPAAPTTKTTAAPDKAADSPAQVPASLEAGAAASATAGRLVALAHNTKLNTETTTTTHQEEDVRSTTADALDTGRLETSGNN